MLNDLLTRLMDTPTTEHDVWTPNGIQWHLVERELIAAGCKVLRETVEEYQYEDDNGHSYAASYYRIRVSQKGGVATVHTNKFWHGGPNSGSWFEMVCDWDIC